MGSSFPYKSVPGKLTRSRLQGAVSLLAALLGVFLISLSAFSQGNQGTILGGVFDQTGGAIAGATVTLIDVARGSTRALTTDGAGEYLAASLTPGTYTVRAEAKGFRTVEHTGVLVEVGQNIRIDLVVQPGEQTQTITVTGEVAEVNTTDATLGGTVSNQAINALPLNGRNFERLLQLRPGVVTQPGAGAGDASTNGRRTGNDLLLVEGIAQIGPSNGTTTLNSVYRTGDANSLVPIDAIQEFNTQQDYKAEYGWRDGSVINVGLKSGTNSIHGAAYAFGRDASATDANNFFTPGQATPATVEQFGAVAGGPIIKDKLFWFMGYEGLRTTLTNPVVDTIPSDISLGGDPINSMVDACLAVGAANVNPLSARLAGLTGVASGSCAVSPASSTVENLFPYNPNASINFTPNLVTTGPLNNGFIKGDYVLGPHHHLSGFYFVSKSFQNVGYNTAQLLPQWQANVPSNVQMYNGAWTWTPNSTWVNDFRMGYSYLHAETHAGDVNMIPSNPWPAGYGFNTGVTNPLYGGLPLIQFSDFTGYLGAGKRTGVRGPEGNASLVETVSYLHGKHAFKFGFDFVDVVYDNNAYNYGNGNVKFKHLTDFLLGNPRSGGQILIGDPNVSARAHWFAGFAQDDWRLTTRVTVNLGLRYEYNGSPVERHNYEGNFNPNVNPLTTSALQQAGPGAPIHSLINGDRKDFSPRVGVAWDVRGNGKTVVRAGASLLRNPEVVGEYIGFVPFGANIPSIGVNTSGTAMNAHTSSDLSLAAKSFNWTLAGPVFPGNASTTIGGVTYTGLTCTVALPCSTQAVDPNFRQPYSAQWNLDIQRAITNNLTVDLAYVGVHGSNEPAWMDINQPPIGAGWDAGAVTACLDPTAVPLYSNCSANTAAEVGPFTKKFPYLGEIAQLGNQDFSNYNALQLTVNERTSHGLSFIAGYTYSHALDMLSADSASQQLMPIDTYHPRLNYGNSDNDVRHRFTLSPSYAIPGRKSPGQMLQGWSVSGILTMQSGLPWFPVDVTNDILGTGEFQAQPLTGITTWNYSGPRSAFTSGPQPIQSGTLQQCMTAAQAPYTGNAQLMQLAVASLTNLGCYVQGGGILTPPAYGTVGNASRNLFSSPRYYNVDLSIAKEWKIKERLTVQFRTEFFNLFNRADFAVPGSTGQPSVDPNSGVGGQFGCSCQTPDVAGNNPVLGSGGPRHIQFGLKLLF
jgi:Carboxypeptidase regulatory-like domain/TonB dependent receptor